MTIYQRMDAAFANAQVPGFLQEWERTDAYPEIPAKFGVYIVSRTAPALSADDCEAIRGYSVIVHLYGTSDLSAEAAAICEAAENLDFVIADQRDLADVSAGDYRYHRRLDLMYYEYLWEDEQQ